LRAPVVPRASLLADAGRRTFGLLDGHLLDKRLRLAVQVPRLGRRRGGHGPQQRCGSNELLARSRGHAWIVDVEVGVDAIAGLSAQFPCAFAALGGFPGDGGSKQPHRAVLLREHGFKLARLSQLCVDVGPSVVRREGRLAPQPGVVQFPYQGEPLRRQLLPR
jgi:hypothetical protein